MIDLASDDWFSALRLGLGAQVQPIDAVLPSTYLAMFRAGPFRIAYPEFPFGILAPADHPQLAVLAAQAREIGADVVRVQCRTVPVGTGIVGVHRLQTVRIERLDEWDESRIEKARRARNRLARTPVAVRKGTSADGEALHRLYEATVARHGGGVRYSRKYFELIAPHAALIAEFEGQVCGFVCAGRFGSQGVYLHGGHDPAARAHYPSDILFLSMLRAAKAEGLGSFDFLASPPAQHSLVGYKLAWGGAVVDVAVCDLAIRPFKARLFELAYALAKALRAVRQSVRPGGRS
jgi:hypothetical protein